MTRFALSDLRYRDYWLFLGSIFASEFGMQMSAVAIGWQVYAVSGKPLDLGLVGLCEFMPLLLLALRTNCFCWPAALPPCLRVFLWNRLFPCPIQRHPFCSGPFEPESPSG